MKNKHLLTVKFALVAMIFGLFGIVGAFLVNDTEVSAATSDTTLAVSVTNTSFELNVVSPSPGSSVGDTFSLDIQGFNISTADVYIDFNSNGIFDNSEKVGSFMIDNAGNFGPGFLVGPIHIPSSTSSGVYDMKVIGQQKNGGTAKKSSTISIQYDNKQTPQIDSILPNFGLEAGGTDIIIKGKNFEKGSEIYIGDNKCLNVEVVSLTEIHCTTPSGPVGKVAVIIVGSNGTYTDVDGFLYYKNDDNGNGGGIGIPNVPNTGLFRVGDTVVMSSDLVIVGLAIVILVVSLIFLHESRKDKKNMSKTKNANKKKKNY